MTSARKRARVNLLCALSAAAALTIGFPHAAAAAPAPCERAEAYAAQSGAQLIRVDRLAGARISNVGAAEAKSALVAQAAVNSAAVTRMLDADKGTPYTDPLSQQAPPTNASAARRMTDAGEIGPFALGRGTMISHAQWDPRMACGLVAGQATRAEAAVRGVGMGDVMRAPRSIRSRSTTALASGGRTIAGADVQLPEFDLLDGAVHVKVVRSPSLSARMSRKDGGEVRYVPPALQVSGDGIHTRRLDGPGDTFEAAVEGDRSESATGSSTRDDMTDGVPLDLPAVPGLPRLGDPEKSVAAGGSGTRVRITLGDVRQAVAGNAIAAKATAIQIAITEAPARDENAADQTGAPRRNAGERPGYDRTSTELGVGLLEAAAVAPEPRPGGTRGGVQGAVSADGGGGGLPITGSPAAFIAIGGVALVIAGAALAFGARRRRLRP